MTVSKKVGRKAKKERRKLKRLCPLDNFL